VCLQAAFYSSFYFVTAMLSELLTNNATAALMYPIASIAGDALGEWLQQGWLE
jgi:di/tricarboxylate transporter